MTQLSQGLDELLNRPWHRRIWISQEVWAAEDLDVLVGSYALNWKALLFAADVADSLSGWSKCREDFLPWYKDLAQASLAALALIDEPRLKGLSAAASALEGQSTDLIAVLQRSAQCDCSNLRGHVYGVLGMTTCMYTGGISSEPNIAFNVHNGRLQIVGRGSVCKHHTLHDTLKPLTLDLAP